MATIRLKGQITEDGRLEVDLPDGLESGEVNVVIETAPPSSSTGPAWTDEEIEELTRIEPKSGADIVAGLGAGWESLTTSGSDWVEQLRRRRREQSQW